MLRTNQKTPTTPCSPQMGYWRPRRAVGQSQRAAFHPRKSPASQVAGRPQMSAASSTPVAWAELSVSACHGAARVVKAHALRHLHSASGDVRHCVVHVGGFERLPLAAGCTPPKHLLESQPLLKKMHHYLRHPQEAALGGVGRAQLVRQCASCYCSILGTALKGWLR